MNLRVKNFFLFLIMISLNFNLLVLAQDTGSIYDEVLQGGGVQPQDVQGIQQAPSGYGQVPSGNAPLKGRVVVAPAGSRFEARLSTTLSSGVNNIGDVITATVSSPLAIGSDVLIPAGSQLIGQVVDVKSARMFMAGAGGELAVRFTSVQTPNGQRFPLSANVDTTQFRLAAETAGSRTAKVVGKTAVGAGIGALGGLVGAAIGGGEHKGRAAAIGSAIGGGIGAAKGLADKGKEIEIPSGSALPIQLEQALQATVHPGY